MGVGGWPVGSPFALKQRTTHQPIHTESGWLVGWLISRLVCWFTIHTKKSGTRSTYPPTIICWVFLLLITYYVLSISTTHPSIQKVGGWLVGWLVGWFAIHAKKSGARSTHLSTIIYWVFLFFLLVMHLSLILYNFLIPTQQPPAWWQLSNRPTHQPPTHPYRKCVGGWLVGSPFALKKRTKRPTHPYRKWLVGWLAL